jgi:hypothetical protein
VRRFTLDTGIAPDRASGSKVPYHNSCQAILKKASQGPSKTVRPSGVGGRRLLCELPGDELLKWPRDFPNHVLPGPAGRHSLAWEAERISPRRVAGSRRNAPPSYANMLHSPRDDVVLARERQYRPPSRLLKRTINRFFLLKTGVPRLRARRGNSAYLQPQKCCRLRLSVAPIVKRRPPNSAPPTPSG